MREMETDLLKNLLQAEKRLVSKEAGVQFQRMICEHQHIEETLRHSELFTRAILDALSAHVCVVNEEGLILTVNDAWKTFAAANALQSGKVLQGANYLSVCDMAANNGCQDAAAFAEGLRTVLRGELVEYCQEYDCHSHDTERWFMVRVTRCFSENTTMAVIMHEDITERKIVERELAHVNEVLEFHVQERTTQLRDAIDLFQKENATRKRTQKELETLAKAIEQASDAVVITDHKGTIEYVNSAFERLSGYSRKEAIGKNPRILKSNKHNAAFYKEMWEMLTRGEIWRGQLTNRRKDGTFWEENTTISPIRDIAGHIVNYVAVKRDLSQIMRLEYQLRQAQKMEAVGSLAGGIAHDFNNILAAIIGYTELSHSQVGDNSEVVRYLDEVLNASHRAADLIQQILMLSRQTEQERKPVSIVPTVKESLKLLRGSLPPSIEFQCEIDSRCPCILADPTQIHQVMMNLGTNAFHAMEKDGGTLTVSLKCRTITHEQASEYLGLSAGKHVCLTVSDTGHGMDEATRLRIFDPYFTTKPEGKGTGLGLSIVHGIVSAHQGTIHVTSEVGHGTSFVIHFPVTEITEENVTMDSGELKSGHGERIMLVDDETWVLETNTRLLKRIGYEVAPFLSPVEALERFHKTPSDFDLVIVDNAMPKLDGVTLARELASCRSNIKVILMTGMAPASLAQEAKDAGIQRVVMKPASLAMLAKAIYETMGETKPPEP